MTQGYYRRLSGSAREHAPIVAPNGLRRYPEWSEPRRVITLTDRGNTLSARVTPEPALLAIGTDHTLAPLALRERLALGGDGAAQFLLDLRADPAIVEAALLSTCNRAEVYLATTDPERAVAHVRRAFAALLGDQAAALDALLVVRTGAEAVRHLCAVAAGLQSMIVAEGQILGQVRAAHDQAQKLGTAGLHLSAAFRAAVACGKRVRTETAIGRADISASSVLIDLIARSVPHWPSQRVLLVGAGRMNQVIAEKLQALGAGTIVVASRTPQAAAALAGSVGGQASTLDRVPELARQATLIVSATRSPGLTITAAMLAERPPEPLLVADLAVPRDVDPAIGDLQGVRLLDIDDLRDLQDKHGLGEALAAAERMVEEATAGWIVWCRTREAVPLIADLRAHVDRQKEQELARTLAQLEHLSEDERAAVGELAHRLVNKMFHHLAIRMKQAAADPDLGESYLEAARYLFSRDEAGEVVRPEAMAETARPGVQG